MKKRKRQYYRTTALLGAQPQMASWKSQKRWRVHIRWQLVVPIVIIVGVLLWLWLDDRWYVMGEDLKIVGTTSNALAKEAAIASDLLGWHSLRLRPRDATVRVMDNVASVAHAGVSCRRFPASCVINVVEREPVLVWIAGTKTFWSDAEGYLFSPHGEHPDLPTVRGDLPDSEVLRIPIAALEGVNALASLGVATDGLEYVAQKGLIWHDPEGRRVAFGVGKDMASRWQIYNALTAALEARGVFPWVIDVRFPEGPTYAMDRTW